MDPNPVIITATTAYLLNNRETKCSNLTKSQTLKPKKTPPLRGVLFALVSFPVACTKKKHTSSKPSFSSSLPLDKQSHNTSLCRRHNQTEVRSSPPPPGRAPLPRHLRCELSLWIDLGCHWSD
ncbi:hypothetical protein QVD17_09098 [Tagetes erecta]|uniref:Uncharacterized protein n=1 Tax=Tagetes erecta TaxID=13708 RepID=A0AAD8L0Y1_TARER|nr:hypothetical protein QVD17_09098 [Tagetes erecta]